MLDKCKCRSDNFFCLSKAPTKKSGKCLAQGWPNVFAQGPHWLSSLSRFNQLIRLLLFLFLFLHTSTLETTRVVAQSCSLRMNQWSRHCSETCLVMGGLIALHHRETLLRCDISGSSHNRDMVWAILSVFSGPEFAQFWFSLAVFQVADQEGSHDCTDLGGGETNFAPVAH